MFGKLLKYEFKAVGHWYLALYGLSIIASILLGFWLKHINAGNLEASASILPAIVTILTFVGFGVLIASLGLSTLFLVIRRFRENIYGRQGYLTMTLPATTHQILLSKLTAAAAWNFLAAVTILITISLISFILDPTIFQRLDLTEFLNNLPFTTTPLYLLSVLIEFINSILLIYLAIAIGHMAEDRRVLLSFVAYFLIHGLLATIELSILGRLLQNINDINLYFGINIIFQLLIGFIAYFSTHYLIKYKLNIQ
ncbi:ABC transporter permease [Streptococcus ovuberis]|uniref:ABC transporter permease n=1 Tax=Streptococcus ovuberis TaxID=1936207 RepID=A0A7X6S1R6_9STRE|nr:ABC transporter permease [Streptococcus ovuberis]NKZ20446.1 ABC transporter permease [Streptococcus ovuberis]